LEIGYRVKRQIARKYIAVHTVKYEGKKAEPNTNKQYLDKLRIVYKMMFNEKINESIINELQKLSDGKTYNQGVINHIQFLKILIR
jgi:hypothetical protein